MRTIVPTVVLSTVVLSCAPPPSVDRDLGPALDPKADVTPPQCFAKVDLGLPSRCAITLDCGEGWTSSTSYWFSPANVVPDRCDCVCNACVPKLDERAVALVKCTRKLYCSDSRDPVLSDGFCNILELVEVGCPKPGDEKSTGQLSVDPGPAKNVSPDVTCEYQVVDPQAILATYRSSVIDD